MNYQLPIFEHDYNDKTRIPCKYEELIFLNYNFFYDFNYCRHLLRDYIITIPNLTNSNLHYTKNKNTIKTRIQ